MNEPPTMTDADVQAIVDKHAPSQGDLWDMAAMLREAHAAGSAWGYEQGAREMRERCAKVCDEMAAWWEAKNHGVIAASQRACADGIRALDPAPDPNQGSRIIDSLDITIMGPHKKMIVDLADPATEEPGQDSEITDDQIIELAQELVRVTCSKICDEVDAISGWAGDPTDTEKRYKAGVSMACEEIKYRIDSLDIHGWHLAAQAAAAAPPSEGGI